MHCPECNPPDMPVRAVLADGAWGDGMLVEGHVAKDGETRTPR